MNNPIIDNAIKPTSRFASLGNFAIPAVTAGTVISDENNAVQYNGDNNNTKYSNQKKEINLWEFSRLYKIGQIPILDIIIVYVIIYLFNSLFLNYNYKFVLLMIIPVTIFFNILTNEEFKISFFIILIFVISLYYLFSLDLRK